MTFEDFIAEWGNSSDYIKATTSGSTGIPKEISLAKSFVKKSAQRTNSFFGIKEGKRLHSCVSPDFIGGKMMAVRSIIANACLTWEIPSNQPLKHIDRSETLDLVAVVPSQMIYILENLNILPKINNIIVGGSPIHPSLKEKITASRLNVYETYGMTETASHIALRKITTENVPFHILDGITLSHDNEKCLNIKFDSGEEFQTNDLADLISPTEFYIKGRRDQVIISGGKKINPVEIEAKIAGIIKYPFLITGFPDEKWGEKIVLLIEGVPMDYDNSLSAFKMVLKPWEMPKEILFVKELPHTDNGKLKRIKDRSGLSFFVDDKDHDGVGQNMPVL